MSPHEHTRRARVAERAARAGAEVAVAEFRSNVAIETKANKTDYVTQADRDAQRRVVEVLAEAFPDDPVVGEEDDARKTVPESGPAWVVDPIDGTSNFVSDVRVWATSVAAVVDGEPVAAANVLPSLDDVYVSSEAGATLNDRPVSVRERTDPETFVVAPLLWWDYDRRAEFAAACRAVVERFADLRRFGSAQATLSMVAAGQLDGALTNLTAHPWDSVAGVHLVRRAGGTVTDLHGERWVPGAEGLVASNGDAHGELLAAAQEIASEQLP